MIQILFENKDIVAVDKPEGLASIPERDLSKDCLLSLLSSKFKEKLYVVHRLDKEASGIILFAKNADAHKYLNKQFFNHTINKTYLALTHGIIKEENGAIDKPIRQFGSGRMGVDLKIGKASTTKFHVIKKFDSYTLVEAYPLTGRRHQIRVHLYSIAHPIVGDLRYGDKTLQEKFPRLMLHSQKITFSLSSEERITVESPIPESFNMVIENIRNE